MNVVRTACHTAAMDPGTGHGFLLCPTASSDLHLHVPVEPPEANGPHAHPQFMAPETLHRSDRQEMARRLAQLGWRICPADDDIEVDGLPLLVLYTPHPASADLSLDAFVTADAELRSIISQEITRGLAASPVKR
jgi:hypothetical protein